MKDHKDRYVRLFRQVTEEHDALAARIEMVLTSPTGNLPSTSLRFKILERPSWETEDVWCYATPAFTQDELSGLVVPMFAAIYRADIAQSAAMNSPLMAKARRRQLAAMPLDQIVAEYLASGHDRSDDWSQVEKYRDNIVGPCVAPGEHTCRERNFPDGYLPLPTALNLVSTG